MLLFLSNHLHSVCNLPEHATPACVSLLSLTQLTVCVYVEGYACWWWPRPPQSLPPFRPSPSQGEGSRMGSNRQIYPSCSMEACPGPLVSITRRHGHATACGACSPAHTHTRTRILSASMQHINKHNYTIKAWNSCIRTSIQLGTQISKKSTHGQTHLTVKQASSSLPQRSSLQTDILRGDDLLGVCGVCSCVCLWVWEADEEI